MFVKLHGTNNMLLKIAVYEDYTLPMLTLYEEWKLIR